MCEPKTETNCVIAASTVKLLIFRHFFQQRKCCRLSRFSFTLPPPKLRYPPPMSTHGMCIVVNTIFSFNRNVLRTLNAQVPFFHLFLWDKQARKYSQYRLYSLLVYRFSIVWPPNVVLDTNVGSTPSPHPPKRILFKTCIVYF